MQKTVVRNPNQSSIRRNLLNIAGITVQGETITPQNGDRLLGGYGVAWLNNQDAASQTTGQDNPLPECNCESGGGGGGSGGGGGVQPSGNCEKKNISELKQVLDDYASQSFCDKEFPEVQFSTFIGYDKPPSDSTAKEIELRMLCPSDECSDGTFWTSGSANPIDEAIYDVLGYRENCSNIYAQPYLKVRKVSPCEMFERHKAYFKQRLASVTPPSKCSTFYWWVTFKYYSETYYNQRFDGLTLPDAVVDEVAALVLNKSYEQQTSSQLSASFRCFCDENDSWEFRAYFECNLYIYRLYEENCQNVKCDSGCVNVSCYDNPDCNCDFGNERIYERCCNGG